MLITLVIIGVVAALTIPNLMQKYTEQTTVKKVQKFYSTLANAYSLAIRENGQPNEWGLTDSRITNAEKIYELLFKPYFKIAKDCGVYNRGNCFPQYTTWLDGTEASKENDSGNYKVTLNDGSSVKWYKEGNTYIIVMYDVNGPKSPNRWGEDIFMFGMRQGLQRPFAYGEVGNHTDFNTYCNKKSTAEKPGRGCAGWVIYKGNMDYLHCDDLSWTGKDKCK